jgi:tryptophan synthase alpha chain
VNGAERIVSAFRRAEEEGRTALVVFLAAGDPDQETTVELARAAVEAGADVLELGVPFSDPLADGPVIQAAYTRALAGGSTTAGVMDCAARIVRETEVPVVLMVGLNCVLARGYQGFCAAAAEAGASGILVPDLPVDDAGELREAAEQMGLGTIFLVGPDSGPERVAEAAAASTGFVYVMRLRGITGAGSGGVDLERRIKEARAAASAPVAVGFGISTPADAAEVAGVADGVIVGSALVDAAFRARDVARDREEGREEAVRAVRESVAGLSRALRGGTGSHVGARRESRGGARTEESERDPSQVPGRSRQG